MSIDVGTGDGHAVLAAAARAPRHLVIGIDADAASMTEASRRAARPARKGGLPNALFAVATAAAPPPELGGLAELVTVTMPWGSLLCGCLGADAAVTAGIRSLLAAGGRLELLLAPADRDHLAGMPTEPRVVVAAARATFEQAGLVLTEGRPATADDLHSRGSSWARRLIRSGRDRRAVLVRFACP